MGFGGAARVCGGGRVGERDLVEREGEVWQRERTERESKRALAKGGGGGNRKGNLRGGRGNGARVLEKGNAAMTRSGWG